MTLRLWRLSPKNQHVSHTRSSQLRLKVLTMLQQPLVRRLSASQAPGKHRISKRQFSRSQHPERLRMRLLSRKLPNLLLSRRLPSLLWLRRSRPKSKWQKRSQLSQLRKLLRLNRRSKQSRLKNRMALKDQLLPSRKRRKRRKLNQLPRSRKPKKRRRKRRAKPQMLLRMLKMRRPSRRSRGRSHAA